jgi:HNH endonuclease.
MAKTKINCLNCQKEIYVDNKEIKRGFGKFCGRNCSAQFNARNIIPPEPNVKCAYCSVSFYITASRAARSKRKIYFCCQQHHDAAQRIGGVSEVLPAHYGTGENYRRIVFAIKPKKCERCAYDKHEAAIIVHHIDRNRDNNDLGNLEVLCANCHAIEHYGEEEAC